MTSETETQELISEVKELTRTLRGHNGTPGLLTEFALYRKDVQDLTKKVDDLNTNGCNFMLKAGDKYPKQSYEKIESSIEKQAPTFKWLTEKFAVPIIVALIVGFLNMIVLAKYIAPLFK